MAVKVGKEGFVNTQVMLLPLFLPSRLASVADVEDIWEENTSEALACKKFLGDSRMNLFGNVSLELIMVFVNTQRTNSICSLKKWPGRTRGRVLGNGGGFD